MVSAVWGLSYGVLAAAAPSKTFPTGMKPLIVTFSVVGGTLLMAGVIYMNGALRAWGGRKVGGKATAAELSEALALSQIPIVLCVVLSGLVAILIRFTHGDQLPVKVTQSSRLWTYPIVGIGAALIGWSLVLSRNCILEVQGFSAAQGRRAFRIGMKRYFLLLTAAAAVLVGASFALRLFRG